MPPLHKEIVNVQAEKVVGFTCDRCGTSFDENEERQLASAQVFDFESVEGSDWGENVRVQIVICDTCSFEVLHPYAAVSPLVE